MVHFDPPPVGVDSADKCRSAQVHEDPRVDQDGGRYRDNRYRMFSLFKSFTLSYENVSECNVSTQQMAVEPNSNDKSKISSMTYLVFEARLGDWDWGLGAPSRGLFEV